MEYYTGRAGQTLPLPRLFQRGNMKVLPLLMAGKCSFMDCERLCNTQAWPAARCGNDSSKVPWQPLGLWGVMLGKVAQPGMHKDQSRAPGAGKETFPPPSFAVWDFPLIFFFVILFYF